MQVKNRIFPYPVLNNNAFISNYKDIKFELHYDEYNDNEYYVLKNIRFSTNNLNCYGADDCLRGG